MKTIPRTKHSNKYNQEKNRLVSKALFEKKLDAMKGYVEEYLKSNPIDIKCKDIQDEVKYTVFVSVSDGKKRARVCHASAADFEASFMKLLLINTALRRCGLKLMLWILFKKFHLRI